MLLSETQQNHLYIIKNLNNQLFESRNFSDKSIIPIIYTNLIMSSYNQQSQPSSQNPNNSQPIYRSQYSQPPINQPYQNVRTPPGYGYPSQQYQQYPPQQYPPQQQQPYPPYQPPGFPIQNPYQNMGQINAPQYNQDINQPYGQNQLSNPNQQQPPAFVPPTAIPPNSPLLRHKLSSITSMIKKNLQQFSPQFQQKFTSNQDFKSLNRKLVFIPSFLIMGHVILNRNKKWFRLTVNARAVRYSLVGLLLLHFSTNVLYVAANRDMIARNRERIEKIVVREELLGGDSGSGNRVV